MLYYINAMQDVKYKYSIGKYIIVSIKHIIPIIDYILRE